MTVGKDAELVALAMLLQPAERCMCNGCAWHAVSRLEGDGSSGISVCGEHEKGVLETAKKKDEEWRARVGAATDGYARPRLVPTTMAVQACRFRALLMGLY